MAWSTRLYPIHLWIKIDIKKPAADKLSQVMIPISKSVLYAEYYFNDTDKKLPAVRP